jgi:hypothetical protein
VNITFLIGNGFDLSLGLKTTYEDAFNFPGVLSNQIVGCNEWDNLMNLLRNNGRNSEPQWCRFEEVLVDYCKEYIHSEDDFINFKRFKTDLSNLLVTYFYTTVDCGITDKTTNFFNFLKKKNTGDNYFLNEAKKIDEDSELKVIKYNDYYSEFVLSVTKFYERLENDKSQFIIDYIIQNTENTSITLNFVNFNYTNSLEKFVKRFKKDIDKYSILNKKINIGDLHYIHGSIKNTYDNSQMIQFGITDPNLQLTMGYDFEDNLKSVLTKTNTDFMKWCRNSDLIIVHGLSMGKSERYYLNIIDEYLKCNKILIDFPYIQINRKSISDLKYLENVRKCIFTSDYKNNVIVDINPNTNTHKSAAGIFHF